MNQHARSMREKISALASRIARQSGDKLPVIEKGTPEWGSWLAYRARHGIPSTFMESREKWTVPTEMPPEDIDQMLLSVGGGRLKDKLKT